MLHVHVSLESLAPTLSVLPCYPVSLLYNKESEMNIITSKYSFPIERKSVKTIIGSNGTWLADKLSCLVYTDNS